MYDSIIVTGILLLEAFDLVWRYRKEQRTKKRAENTKRFNKTLKANGLKLPR